ncbi:MAG: DGQHR domain-containing protein [Eikenella sp.]|nr:DGQHR domain-containing protein [Eikenella sp.]
METKYETIKKQAFDLSNDSVKYYVTVMNADELFKLSTVSRADEDPTTGYQRLLNEKRAKDIAEYIDAGNIIPGAIILSAQKNAEINFDSNKNEINITAHPNSFFVIDGQHRLYGMKKASNDISVPVCILVGLNLQQEVQYFLDINSNQKGVPKTLRIELMKFLSEPDSIDSIRNTLFKQLNNDNDSPLFGKLSATSSTPGKLSLVPFQNALDPLLTTGTLGTYEFDTKKKILINFLSAVKSWLLEAEGNSNKLYTSAFFQAIFKIFEKACSLTLAHFQNYQQESFEKILKEMPTLDFEQHTGSNEQAISRLAAELSNLLDIANHKLGTPSGLV